MGKTALRSVVFAHVGIALMLIGSTAQYGIKLQPKVLQPGQYCCSVNTTSLWKPAFAGLGQVEAARITPLFNYSFFTPKSPLRAGLTHYGPADRLRHFVANLLEESRPLRVGVVGGSISWGEGASRIGITDWFATVGQWLKSVAKADLTTRNGCQPATTSAYMELCLRYAVDPEADLIFVEYIFNDGTINQQIWNPTVLVMERLIRRLLDLPGRPAVVLLQVPHVNGDDGYDPFYATSEDAEAALASYYDLPTVSSRVALWQAAELYPEPGFWWTDTYRDHHPGDAGHRVMADLVVHLIQRAALDVAVRPVTAAEAALRERPLPPPMYKRNMPSKTSNCVVGSHLTEVVQSHVGWEWVNEGTEQKPKRGYVSNKPGSTLVLLLNTLTFPEDALQNVLVMLSLLTSYRPMGVLRLECIKGCACRTMEYDVWITKFRATQTQMFQVEVSQAEQCYMLLKVVDRPSANGTARSDHKVKVSGVVVTDWIRPPPARFETWAWGLGLQDAGLQVP